jgi:predicted permease
MQSLWYDIRSAARNLAKSPGFTAVAVITLALGIGANTAIFTALNAVLLRSLPVDDPQRLVVLSNPEAHGIGVGDGSGKRYLYPYSEFQDLRDRNHVFSGLCASDSHVRKTEVALANSGPEFANVSLVSGNYFSVLAVRPYKGRTFTTEVDKAAHAAPVAVISHGYWKNRFALDPAIVGRKMRINRMVFDIVGVAQPGFAGETVGFATDIWAPLTMQNEVFPAWTDFLERPQSPLEKILWLQLIGRLKPGITKEQAQAGINLTSRQIREAEAAGLAADRRREYMDSRILLADGAHGANNLSDSLGDPLKMLMVVVGLILLIACANTGTLALARGEARRREIAVRLALGAARRRVVQQLLTESLLPSVIGGAIGILLAQWIDILLIRLIAPAFDGIFLNLRPDARVLAFTFGVSVLAGILFGVAPGLRATDVDVNSSLKAGAKGSASGGNGRLPAGRVLVAAQIALSLSVLIVAGLFVHSFQNLTHVNPGFDHDHVLSFDIGFLESSGYKGPAVHRVHTAMLARLKNIPGVKGATLAFMGIFVGNDTHHQISMDGTKPKTDD